MDPSTLAGPLDTPTRFGVPEVIKRLVWSPSGTWLALVTRTDVHVFDATTGATRAVLEGQYGRVNDLAWGSDDEVVLVTPWRIRNQSVDSGEVNWTRPSHEGQGRAVASSARSPWLACEGNLGDVGLFDFRTGMASGTLRDHRGRVYELAFSPDGQKLASGGGKAVEADRVVRVWDTRDRAVLRRFSGHEAFIAGLDWAPDGTRLVSGGADGRVIIWDVERGDVVSRHALHGHEVRGVAFTPDGRHVLSAGRDGTLRVWDVDDGVEVKTLHLPEDPRRVTTRIVFRPGSWTAAVGVGAREVRLVDFSALRDS